METFAFSIANENIGAYLCTLIP